MDRDTIIDGLRMTMDLCVFDPSTGDEIDPHLLNDISRATYDACKGALEILERLEADSDTISRAKAIAEVEKARAYVGHRYNIESMVGRDIFEILDSVGLGISELPPANCSEFPNSSDTISRQQAIDTLRGYLVGKRCPDDGTLTCRLIENEVINKLRPAQPERIKGHWICDRSWSEGVGMGESYGHYWKCDKCGHLEQGDWGECGCNFCSNCGSDNREVTE